MMTSMIGYADADATSIDDDVVTMIIDNDMMAAVAFAGR